VLPIAVEIKKVAGARVVYDSHEFAREEHAKRWLWRLLYRPHVCATETAGVRAADRVVTIGPGIARLLSDTYRLSRGPEVILNVPNHRTILARPINQKLELLYHGLMTAGRGIETLILAAAQVKRPTRLVLRGDGKQSYVDGLRRLAEKCACPGRIVFASAVPFDEVIEAASAADVGLFTPPLTTPQERFMLPNKLFEYMMAGLMVIFSDGDDVSEIIRRYGCGVVLSDVSASSLAAVIDRLEPDEIKQYKDRALQSAHLFCWEREQSKLVALYNEFGMGTTNSRRTAASLI
jgi:glycosyltransferase involved in cell wall biosynthesis